MTFEEYWVGVEKLKALPQMAIQQLPISLSENTKIRLMKKRLEETVEMLNIAIDRVNHGSVENIDFLVKRML